MPPKRAKAKAAPKKAKAKRPAKRAPAKRPGPWSTIVAPEAVAPFLGHPDLVILDCRHDLADASKGPAAYAEAHVPGAVHAHVDTDLSSPIGRATGRHPLPDAEPFRRTASAWGIGPGVQVVCYDDRGGIWASRAWWLLRDFGHREVAVLDGGIPAWKEAGLPLAREVPTPKPRRFEGRPGHMPTVGVWDLVTRAPPVLVDARAPERYRGEVEPVDPVAGHIPGAVNVPNAANLGKDGRFLPPEELRKVYGPLLGSREAKEAAFYCGSGVTAPHDILAMEVAGLPGAALYPGSWSHWIRDRMRPVAKGGEP